MCLSLKQYRSIVPFLKGLRFFDADPAEDEVNNDDNDGKKDQAFDPDHNGG